MLVGWLYCGGGLCSDNFGRDEKLIMMMNKMVIMVFKRSKETEEGSGHLSVGRLCCAVGEDSDVITCISVIMTMRS